ncbi:20S proteasome subunit [Pyrrhoderma noxium]|uniref:Proteasome subunit beta n=1 Tax=Pyrrhoderma noxium TaxID=2282107 RepID=A0A286ULW4_9AGAM|nr:20S proteasome subunit [Pyrrhoderma noxium]
MECSFALVGRGYVIVASDTVAARSIVKMKSDEDKIKTLGPHLLMSYSGEPGDTVHFAEPAAAASWIRRAIADSIRSRSPYAVNVLVGGFDTSAAAVAESGADVGGIPKLYWIDNYGTLAEVPFAAHGYGAYFALSLLDRYHNPEGTLEEGLATLKRCIDETALRFIVGGTSYKVKVVDKDGVREVSL